MADYLDSDLAICEVDPVTKEIKATPYFEDYLYKIISTLGGEGSTAVSDIIAISVESDKYAYFFSMVERLAIELSQFNKNVENSILNAQIKETNERTANFTSKIKQTNYTAINKDWIEARSGIQVTFPESPVRDDEIMVSNGDGSAIKIYGNGYNFKYTSTSDTFITRNIGSSYHFQFFQDNDLGESYWRVR